MRRARGGAAYGRVMPPHAPHAPAPSMEQVAEYRALVASLSTELDRQSARHGMARPHLSKTLFDYLATDQARVVVERSSGCPAELTERSVGVMRDYHRTAAATAATPVEMVTVLLLQQIELAWWADTPDFQAEAEVAASPVMLDLRRLRRRGEVQFGFSLASDRLTYRARNYAIRHWFPNSRPGTSGPSSPYARPEVVSLLNALAREFAARVPSRVPGLWVNSITRPLDHQYRLQALGFTAHVPSAHCRGWAADIETEWYERFGVRGVLEDMLAEFRDAGALNGIDEGRIWHVSPSPVYVNALSSSQQPRRTP